MLKKCATCRFSGTCEYFVDDFYSEESNECETYKKRRYNKGKLKK